MGGSGTGSGYSRVLLILLAFGYLCGSIPFGLILGRLAGVDVRRTGSGNIGATNVARSVGLGVGVATLIADALKGTVPVLVAGQLGASPALSAGVGVAAFLGHVFPVTLHFVGGKGVATAVGVLAVLAPVAVACAAAAFVAVVAVTRYVSLGSVVAAVCAPAVVAALGYPRTVLAASLAMSALIIVRHRGNYARLLAGTEARFTVRKRQAVRPG
jgi:glycerol-3-phosphate acyltransferase PlsY